MKAIVFEKPNKMVVKEVDIPKISSNEVLLKSKVTGICRSDFDLLEGDYIIPLHWPIIPGHEYSGEIVEIGEQVKGYSIGDRVVGECAVGCGVCELCKSGYVNCCPTGDHFGFTIDGSMAEYVKVNASWLHKIPDNLSYTEGALIEPFTVGYFSLSNIGGVNGSDTVIILGAGVIGLCATIAAKGMGAKVIVVDRSTKRLEMASTLGADFIINTSNDDLVGRALELTDGKGAEVVIEAIGADPLMQKMFDIVAQTGKISFTGISFNDNLPVPLHKIQAKGLTVKGNIGSPFIWDEAIRFLSNIKPKLSLLATHEFDLDHAKEAFEQANKTDESIKVMINSN